MNPAPPKISSLNAQFAVVLLAITVAGIAAVIYSFNPSAHNFYPVCQFHRLTGLNCPGCGGTRAAYALLHGEVATALRDNALFVAGLPILAARAGWLALNRWRGRTNGPFFPPRWLLPLLVVVAVFGVLRNLPAFAFLSP
jgi:hypothetical protein